MKQETPQSPSQSEKLVAFVHGLSLDRLPSSVVAHARWCLLDSLGCAYFGSRQPWAKIMAEEMFAEASRGRSTVAGRPGTLAAPAAALCNGTAIHGFELDDLLDEAIVHPGATVLPAALAAAEAVNAPGSGLLLGIAAGYEVADRVGRAVGLAPARRGHHTTAVVAPVGAAVAAGIAMGLSPAQLLTAIGLACSTASGTKSFAAGTGGGMMKRMHAGRAAESGVRMAQLAARDFTAPPTALDGRFGLLEVFGGEGARPALLAQDLGEHWAVENVYVKVYPCCAWIQASVQQLVALRGPQPLAPEEVAKVKIGVCSYAVRNNGQPAPPDTMGAQYSIPYCAALALTADPTDPANYEEKAVNDPVRRTLAQRIELIVDEQMEAVYPRHYGARVELELASGERRSSVVLDPHGMPADPCTETERMEKFSRLASTVMPPRSVDKLAQSILRTERLNSVRELAQSLD